MKEFGGCVVLVLAILFGVYLGRNIFIPAGEDARTAAIEQAIAATSTPTVIRAYTPKPTPTIVRRTAASKLERGRTPTHSATRYYVGNTGGDGVYIRRSPELNDRIRAWPDGTTMISVGDMVIVDYRKWHKVRDPDGNVGFVPSAYLLVNRGAASVVSKPTASAPSKSPATRRQSQNLEWYQGGTLHDSTLGEWNMASERNKLATAGDWALHILTEVLGKSREEVLPTIRRRADLLETCISTAAEDPEVVFMKSVEAALFCGAMMWQ